MKTINQADIWKQQKYNNSCAWDCISMLLKTQGVKTSTLELVGSSHIPYQISFRPEENLLQAGMLVQKDRNVNAAIGKYGFHLFSTRKTTITDYIALAGESLLNGDAFITNINRPSNLPGRHAVVFTEFRNSRFLGLDPDCRLDRSKDYCFADVKDSVTLRFTEDEFVNAVSGNDGFVPLLGILKPCDPHEPEPAPLQDIFRDSEKSLEFYLSATEHLDFGTEESLALVYSVIKPIVSDLRTAIKIRDDYLKQKSEIASFLKLFENEILNYRVLAEKGETIPEETKNTLHDYLDRSYTFLEEHLSFETYISSIGSYQIKIPVS
jgi:hypothetical protein